MSAKIKDMTTGRPLPLIISFALPLMVGNIFQQLYTVVDTMVVGKAWVWMRWLPGCHRLAVLDAAWHDSGRNPGFWHPDGP